MLTKDQITTFMNRITVDRSLRIDKTMLLEICEQAMNAVDLRINMVPNNGRTAILEANYKNLEEALAAFEEFTGIVLPRSAVSFLPRPTLEMTHAEALQVAADINSLPDTAGLVMLSEEGDPGFNLPMDEALARIQEGSTDPVALDGLSIEEMLDSPLTDVPTNGTVVAGGNPPCDTKTQKSTPPSSPKGKTTHR